MPSLIRMVLRSLLLSLFLIPLWGNTQTAQLDSLIQQSQQLPQDTQLVRLYAQIAQYSLASAPAQSDSFALLGIQLAQKLKDQFGLAWNTYHRSQSQISLGQIDSAKVMASKAAETFEELGEDIQQHRAYYTLANIHNFTGNIDSALYFALRVHEKAAGVKDENLAAMVAFQLGNIYRSQTDLSKAKTYYEEAADYFRKEKKLGPLATTLYSLSNVVKGKERYDRVQEVLELYTQLGHTRGLGSANTSLGEHYLQENEPQKALVAYRKALGYFEQIQYPIGISIAELAIGKILIGEGQYQEAKKALDHAMELSYTHHFDDNLPQIFEQQIRLATATGRLVDADNWLDSFKTARDTMFSRERTKALSDAHARYETSQKEAQLAQQELALSRAENDRNRTLLIALLAISILTIAFFVLRNQLLNKRRAAEIAMQWERAEAEKLRELDQLKSNFFTNISHEFRTPLSLLLSPLRQMIEGTFLGNREHFLKLMERNGTRLESLINQLLDLARLESGKIEVQLASGDIVYFLRILASSFESWAMRKDIQFDVDLPNQSLEVAFDADKLHKVINNLLSNAFKYTPEEGSVSIKANAQDKLLEIEITDTGIGIPPDQLPHIFDRFTRGEQLDDELASSGIGLALTKELVELMQGEIWVKSNPVGGSIFGIQLPVLSPTLAEKAWTEAPHAISSQTIEAQTSPPLSPMADSEKALVLVVEDNKDLNEYISSQLQDKYKLLNARDGKAGLSMALEAIPDLIITDVMMPEMNGNELTRQLKSDARTSHIPIIMLTAKAEQVDKLEGLETGADNYLTKPFDVAELRIRVKQLIAQRASLRSKFATEGGIKLKEIAVSSTDQQFLDRLMEVIETNMADDTLSIEELSDHMAMSRTQLHRKLKALTGKSASVFLRTVRLHRAKDLLSQQAGNVSEICFEVGFSNVAYFSKTFKDEFGKSPSEVG